MTSRDRSRPLAPPHYHEKEGPGTCRDRVGARLGRGARSLGLSSTLPCLCTDSSPLARGKIRDLDFHPLPPTPALPPSRGGSPKAHPAPPRGRNSSPRPQGRETTTPGMPPAPPARPPPVSSMLLHPVHLKQKSLSAGWGWSLLGATECYS